MKVLPHSCRPDQLTAYEASQAATVTQARTLAHPNEGYHAIAANERRRGLDLTPRTSQRDRTKQPVAGLLEQGIAPGDRCDLRVVGCASIERGILLTLSRVNLSG